jgi:hypothetical protein
MAEEFRNSGTCREDAGLREEACFFSMLGISPAAFSTIIP